MLLFCGCAVSSLQVNLSTTFLFSPTSSEHLIGQPSLSLAPNQRCRSCANPDAALPSLQGPVSTQPLAAALHTHTQYSRILLLFTSLPVHCSHNVPMS